jgi:hypothetical protein
MRCRMARTAESPNVSPTSPTQSPRAGLQQQQQQPHTVYGTWLLLMAGKVQHWKTGELY